MIKGQAPLLTIGGSALAVGRPVLLPLVWAIPAMDGSHEAIASRKAWAEGGRPSDTMQSNRWECERSIAGETGGVRRGSRR